MPKTYTAAGTVPAGDVYTAAAHNIIATNVNNFIVPPAVRATRSTVQSIADVNILAINFNGETYDTDGMFGGSGTTFTVQTTGLYIVTATVSFAANATGQRFAFIGVNPTLSGSGDTTTITVSTRIAATTAIGASGSIQHPLCVSATYAFTAGDTVVLGVYQASGVALNTDIGGELPQMAMTWVGRTS